MPDWLKGQIKSLREDLEKGVRGWIVKALGALLLMAVTLWRGVWPSLWHWIWPLVHGIDSEVGRQWVFFLSVVLFFLTLWSPRRRLPIRVMAVELPSQMAQVAVKNIGGSAAFYASMEVLGGRPFPPLLPTWAPENTSNRTWLSREEPRALRLARAVPVEWAGPHSPFAPFAASLEDAGSYNEQRFGWGPPPNGPEFRVPLRLTITKVEEEKWLPPIFFLRPRRSFVSDFVIKGDSHGHLSVEAAPEARAPVPAAAEV